ncbi:MAG: hypothetical protein MJ152_01695, partial [Clostridia bacterium]|nr:hypothetical protein [Clostridia bacterium]
MKYVNVQKGLSFLVWAVVLILLGSCMTFLSVLWSGLAWIGIGFVLTGSVLELVGFIVAGKDDTNHFRQSKYMVIANIFLYVLAVILGAIPNEICQR